MAVLDDGAVIQGVVLVEDSVPDLRLFVLPQIDQFGVAAILEVGDAVIAPAVFIIAQQGAARVGRERSFAGTRKPQQQGAVPFGPLVGRAVQSAGFLRRAAGSSSR